MLKAKDIMTKEPITVSPNTEITKAAKLLLEKGINGVPVVDSGRLVGILCQSDLIAQQKNLPMPSVFTLLGQFHSLALCEAFRESDPKDCGHHRRRFHDARPGHGSARDRHRGDRKPHGGQKLSHPSRGGGQQTGRGHRQGGYPEDSDVKSLTITKKRGREGRKALAAPPSRYKLSLIALMSF
jgi:hypothetical protein